MLMLMLVLILILIMNTDRKFAACERQQALQDHGREDCPRGGQVAR